MTSENDYDEKLWFEHKGCDGKHFFLGNPHTFPGRMWAWCPMKKSSFFVSKDEILKTSDEAKYWIKGFLNGNEPQPPADENGDVNFESKEYLDWKGKIKEFHLSGHWD